MSLITRTVSYLKKNGLKATAGKISRRLSKDNWLPAEEDSLYELHSSGLGCSTSCPFTMPESCPEYQGTVSVIIPTYNGERDLKELLPGLQGQKGIGKLQIILVDSESTDGTVELAKSFGAEILSIRHESFSHSLSRKMGAEKATGDVLAFMTQDALPEDEYWLSKLIYPIAALECSAASCWEKPRPDADLFAKVSAFSWEKVMDQQNRVSVLPEDDGYEVLRYCAQLSDNACAVRAEDYFYVGGHEGKYAEDLNLGLKLLREGKCIAQLTSPHVIHSHNRDAEYYFSRAILDAVSMKKLFPDFVLDNLTAEESANRILTAYLCNILFKEKVEASFNTENLKDYARENYNQSIIRVLNMKKEEALKLLQNAELSFVKHALKTAGGFHFDAGLATSQARYLMHSVQSYIDFGGTVSKKEISSALDKYFGQSAGYTFAAANMGRGGGKISELEKYSKGV